MFKTVKVVFVLGLMLASIMAVNAQEMPPLPGEEVIGGIPSPRGIAFSEDGTLYVAVAGEGNNKLGPEFPSSPDNPRSPT